MLVNEVRHDGIEKDYPKGNQRGIYDRHTEPADPATAVLCQNELLLNAKVVAIKQDNAKAHDRKEDPVQDKLCCSRVLDL